MDADRAEQNEWQSQDEERKYMRRVELVKLAEKSDLFCREDLRDLIYFLNVEDYFK